MQGNSALMDPAEVAQNAEEKGGKQARACVRLVQRACDSCPYQEEVCGLGTDKERWSSLSRLTSPSNTAEPANCTGPGQLWTDTHTHRGTHTSHTHSGSSSDTLSSDQSCTGRLSQTSGYTGGRGTPPPHREEFQATPKFTEEALEGWRSRIYKHLAATELWMRQRSKL